MHLSPECLTLDELRVWEQHHCSELLARPCQRDLVEIGQRHDQADVVPLDERAQSRDVIRVVHPRDKRVIVSVVERRCKRVGVDGNCCGAGSAERAHDVHALPGTCEENGRHGGQYSRNGRLASAEAARIEATTTRVRPGSLSTA